MYFRFLLMISSAWLTDFEDFMRLMRGWQISQSTYLTPSMHPELRLLPVPFLQANLEVNFTLFSCVLPWHAQETVKLHAFMRRIQLHVAIATYCTLQQ